MNRVLPSFFSICRSCFLNRRITTLGLQYQRHGDPSSVLEWGEIETKMSMEDECSVLVKMVAAPINPSDINMIEGTYGNLPKLPAIGGNEGIGIVEEVGSGVENLEVGDWVIPTISSLGTWCLENIFHSDDLFRLDDNIISVGDEDEGMISIEMASSIRINPVSAWRMVHDFVDLSEGDTLILNGCNSQVGRSVLQIALSKGLKTIGIMRDRPRFDEYVDEIADTLDVLEKEEYVFMDLLNSPWLEENRPKLALNCVGGGSAKNLCRALDKNGVMVTYGGMSREPITLGAGSFIFKGLTLTGFWLDELSSSNRELVTEGLREILKLAESGKFVLGNYKKVRFGENEFFESLEASKKEGKLIMIMDDSLL